MTTTDYLTQATDFLRSTGTDFKAEFLKHGKHFDSDKQTRDIYKITLKRGDRVFSFDFGQSIANSGEWLVPDRRLSKVFNDKQVATTYASKIGVSVFSVRKNPSKKPPSEYDVLACLTKYDPESFTAFCHEFGYDTDSKSAEVIYNAVLNEWHNVAMLWNDNELNQLREIQ